MKPSSPLIWLAALAVLAGGGLLYSVARPDPLTDGALEVSPAALTLRGGAPSTLTVGNVGPTSITVELDPLPFLVVDPVSAVARPNQRIDVEVRAVAGFTLAGGDLVVRAGADRVEVPVTLEGELGPGPATAGTFAIDRPEVRFERTVAVVSRSIVNRGDEPVSFAVPSPPAWLRIEPSRGTVAAGGTQVVRLEVDRSTLQVGERSATTQVTSDAGTAAFQVTVVTGPDPILSLPGPTLDFGVGGQLTVRTKTFQVRNAGRGELRYQASADRAFLRLGEGASGVLDPGETAEVSLTFDFKETRTSYSWEAVVPISSNGGSAVLEVTGVSDWSGPTLVRDSNEMDTAHDHCSGGTCERYRHLHATVEDPSRVILVEAAYQVCTGSDPQTAACDGWRMAPKAKRISGTARKGTYEVEIGPLPGSCVPGVAVVIQYRFRLADGLKNSVARPGSSTHWGHLHCSRAD